MAQELSNTQEQQLTQELRQTHSLNAQQVLMMRMLEMPLMQFEESVRAEMDENPALDGDGQEDTDFSDYAEDTDYSDNAEGSDSQESAEDERRDELDSVLENMSLDDRLETSDYERQNNRDPDGDREERVWGNQESFYDRLHEQVAEHELTERQEMIMEYLIGSLDGDGLLRKDLAALSDDIAIHEYIDVSEEEVERVLTILQGFDPPGIGAQSLQQCLQIQILRKNPSPMTKLMHEVVSNHWNDFIRKHWQRIAEAMQMGSQTADDVFGEIRRLNPRPGASLDETMGHSTEQVTPDFILTWDDNENIQLALNHGKVPELRVSRDFEEMIDGYRQNPSSMTRTDKEGLVYAQQKVNRARSYIEAIRQRQRTMTQTMRAIIKLQRKYILTGDDSDLRPMILKDVADLAGVDLTTVSRACSTKYVQMPWGTIRVKQFFSARYDVGGGEEVSTREIKNALQGIIDAEPKGKPLSDIKLAAELKKQGYPIARRTVAKYREQMGIPIAAMRK
ncbi:MAG: RNA polymerase factor sigma-54 [Prevotella sp.]|nr:RNA polymerase factor sigma-54 [Prevotella sp.]